jgi:hypothetical protein
MPDVIWSTDEVASVCDGFGVVELSGLDVLDGRMAGGGYRAKNRVRRGGRDSASLTNCRVLMIMLIAGTIRV